MFYDLEDKKVKNLGNNWSASNASIIGDVTLEKNTSIWFNVTLRGDDDDAEHKKYGVIAQEVEIHNPEVIGEFNIDDENTRMAVKEQQMMWMAIKALQEAQTRIETLETRLETLENA